MHHHVKPGKSNLGHRYQYRPPPVDHPLLATLARPPAKTAVPLPSSVDLRPFAMSVRDQGQEGACTGFASAASREISRAILGSPPSEYFSPAYLYGRTRMKEGTFPADSGASIADEMATLVAYGVCPESFLPYTGNAALGPTPASDVAALPSRIVTPAPVDCTDIAAIKTALACKQPVVIAFTVFESFETPDANGVVPVPSPDEPQLGGHGVCVVGYDDARGAWIVRNSWGPGWSDDGYVHMPYGYEGLWYEAFTYAPQ